MTNKKERGDLGDWEMHAGVILSEIPSTCLLSSYLPLFFRFLLPVPWGVTLIFWTLHNLSTSWIVVNVISVILRVPPYLNSVCYISYNRDRKVSILHHTSITPKTARLNHWFKRKWLFLLLKTKKCLMPVHSQQFVTSSMQTRKWFTVQTMVTVRDSMTIPAACTWKNTQ